MSSFPSFTRLSPRVLLNTPTGPPPPPTAPKLLLLATWMGANDVHIAKYVKQYQQLFPRSPILLVKSQPGDFLHPLKPTEDLQPAIEFLQREIPRIAREAKTDFGSGEGEGPVDSGDGVNGFSTAVENGAHQNGFGVGLKPTSAATAAGASVTSVATAAAAAGKGQPQVLIHVWSNGGSGTLGKLRRLSGLPASSWPAYTIVFDSTPGGFHYWPTYTAFSIMIRKGWLRTLMSPAVHLLVAWFWVLNCLGSFSFSAFCSYIGSFFSSSSSSTSTSHEPIWQSGRAVRVIGAHNNPALLPQEIRRSYIYSDADALIMSSDVVAHAADARAKGFTVREENFGQSAHVAHARVDPGRYWRIAVETWAGRKGEDEGEGEAA